MARASIQQSKRRGITVLGLLLLIIALMVAGFFVVRYLRSRQAVTQSPPLVRPIACHPFTAFRAGSERSEEPHHGISRLIS
jgi:hypothetical protein